MSSSSALFGLSEKMQHLIAVLFLMLLPVILFSPSVIGDQQIVAHDTFQWRASAESVISYVEKTGDPGLWVPNMFSGMPSYTVSFIKAVPHIDTLLFKIFKSIYPAFQYWVLLIGCYVFFLSLNVRKSSAVIGAILIGFSTYFPIIIGAGHNSKFITMSFIPWMFWGYQLFAHSEKKLNGLFIFCFAFLLNLRAGHPQVTYYFFYLLGIWWLFDSQKLLSEKKSKEWGLLTGGFFLAGILGVMSNLQPMWSIIEYGKYSIRGGSVLADASASTGGLNLEYAFAWSQGWYELFTTIIPNAMGGSSMDGTYWGPKSFTSGPHYFGIFTWLFVIAGILLSKKTIKWAFLTTAILTMLFSLGYHFETLNGLAFKFVPFFNKFRTPEMWLIVSGFCLSTLAVIGIDQVFNRIESTTKFKFNDFKVVGYGLVLILLTILITQFNEPKKNGEQRQIASIVAQQNGLQADNPQVIQYARKYVNENVEKRSQLLNKDTFRALLIVIIAIVLLWLSSNKKLNSSFALGALILLVCYDMLEVGGRYIPESIYQKETNVEQVLQSKQRAIDAFIKERARTDEGWSYRTYRLDANAFNSADQAYFYPIVGGYNGAKLSIYQDLIERAIQNGPYGFHTGILDMLNVKYLTAPQGNLPLDGYESVFNKDGLQVIENKNVRPKAWFADSLISVNTPEEAIDIISKPSFNPSNFSVVEAPFSTLKFDSSETRSVDILQYDNHNIEVSVDVSSNQFLVLSEIYYPAGWKAYIDGAEVPIHKTNYVLRGIEVPTGKHKIKFEFSPRSYTLGTTLAWTGNGLILLLGLIAFGMPMIQKKKETTEA